jgi:hypothetical protein
VLTVPKSPRVLATRCPLSSCSAKPGEPCQTFRESPVLRVHGAHAQRIRRALSDPEWRLGDPIPETSTTNATTTEESTA